MIEIILTSSVLIPALAILRRVLQGRIDPRVQYALWLLVAARLLIPGTLFTAPVSVVGAVEDIQTSIRQTVSGPGIPSASPAAPGTSAAKPASEAKPPEQPAAAPAETTELQPDIPESGTQAVQEPDWPVLIWKTGIAVTGGAMLLSNLTFYIRLWRNRRRLTPPAAPWSGNLPVYGVAGLPSPCLFGLFRPAVYLNEAAMNAEHPEHILAHEYAHYRHGDHLWSVLRCVCAAVHWYNPLVWTAAALCRRDCELACDASALRRLGEEERIDYGQTLLGMVSQNRTPAALLHTATTMTAGKRAMTERIALIIRQPRTRKITLALVAGLACVLAACTFGGKAGDGTSALTPEETALLEFPGLHWNDSMETVMETLGITEEQIVSTDEINPGEPVVTVKDFQYFGETAQNTYFYFKQYAETQDEPGLIGVRLDYPDDMDFAPVRNQLAQLYGEGSEDRPDFYEFSESGSIQPVEGNSDSLSDGFRDFLKGVYGEDLLERRAAILEEPGPHRWYWASDNSVLSDEFVRRAAARIVEAQSSSARPYFQPPTQETAEELVRTEPSVYLWWTDAAPIGAFSITSTVNQVQWNAAEYVSFLQNSAAQPVETAGRSQLFEYPGLHWNDPVETVMETLGVTETDFIDSSNNDSDGRKTFNFAIENTPLFGYTAQYVVCRFEQYGENGLGLYSVQVSFPDDMENFDAVWDELVRQYGPASKEKDGVRQIQPSWKEVLGDRYDRWEELQKQPGINTVTWDLAPETLPEGVIATIERYFRLFWQDRHPEDTMEDYLDQFPLGRLTWCSNSMFTPTFNTVTFDGGGYVYCLQNPLENEALENARDVVEGIQAGADARWWLPCLNGIDWANVRQAAVDEGLDDGDGSSFAVDILESVSRYVEQHWTDLDEGSYMDILTATKGLDGAVSESYAGILYQLYCQDPTLFATIALDKLSEEDRDAALRYLLYDWSYFHRLDESLPYQEQLQILLEQLDEDKKGYLRLSPDALVFSYEGEVSQIRIANDMAALSYSVESSNPEVASVEADDGIFTVTAVSPGEATILVHCFTGGEEQELSCSVFCGW